MISHPVNKEEDGIFCKQVLVLSLTDTAHWIFPSSFQVVPHLRYSARSYIALRLSHKDLIPQLLARQQRQNHRWQQHNLLKVPLSFLILITRRVAIFATPYIWKEQFGIFQCFMRATQVWPDFLRHQRKRAMRCGGVLCRNFSSAIVAKDSSLPAFARKGDLFSLPEELLQREGNRFFGPKDSFICALRPSTKCWFSKEESRLFTFGTGFQFLSWENKDKNATKSSR